MEHKIIQANAAHIEALVTLRLDFYQDIGHDLRADGEIADSLRAYYRATLADGSFAAWFIEQDGRPVSMDPRAVEATHAEN